MRVRHQVQPFTGRPMSLPSSCRIHTFTPYVNYAINDRLPSDLGALKRLLAIVHAHKDEVPEAGYKKALERINEQIQMVTPHLEQQSDA
jgi:hypothetical protein